MGGRCRLGRKQGLFSRTKKAIFVTTFSSHIARLKSIVEVSRALNRTPLFLGEVPSTATIAGAVLILAGAVLAMRANKEIADRLCISVRTVDHHRARIMEKLRASYAPKVARLTQRVQTAEQSVAREQDPFPAWVRFGGCGRSGHIFRRFRRLFQRGWGGGAHSLARISRASGPQIRANSLLNSLSGRTLAATSRITEKSFDFSRRRRTSVVPGFRANNW